MTLSELEQYGLGHCIAKYFGCQKWLGNVLANQIVAAPNGITYTLGTAKTYRSWIKNLLIQFDYPDDTLLPEKKGSTFVALPLSAAITILEEIKAEFGTPRELPLTASLTREPTEATEQTAIDR